MKVTDLARVVAPDARQEVIGIRPGEKLHDLFDMKKEPLVRKAADEISEGTLKSWQINSG